MPLQTHVTRAWRSLAGSVYNLSFAAPAAAPHNATMCPALREPSLGFHARVSRQPTMSYSAASLFYNAKSLVDAWSKLLQAAAAARGGVPSTLRHDLGGVSREALAAVSDVLASDVHRAVAAASTGPAPRQYLGGARSGMNALLAEMDALLGSDAAFLLGSWVWIASGWATVRALPGRLSALSVSPIKTVLHGAFAWWRGPLNIPKRRFSVRADAWERALYTFNAKS
jgi:hypothetical protein